VTDAKIWSHTQDVRSNIEWGPEDDSGERSADSAGEDWAVLEDWKKAQEEEKEEAAEPVGVLEHQVAQFLILQSQNPVEGGIEVGDQRLLFDNARKNDKHPAYNVWAVPDDWVVNQNGYHALKDVYFIVKVPREMYDGTD